MPVVFFKHLMTPSWLKAEIENRQPRVTQGSDASYRLDDAVFVARNAAGGVYKRVLTVKLHDLISADLGKEGDKLLKNTPSLAVAIEISFDHHYAPGSPERADDPRTKPMHSVNVMLADGKNAHGYRIEGDPSSYSKNGPYHGARATVSGDTLQNYEQKGASGTEHLAAPTIFPQVFKMLLKPRDGFGTCSSSVNSGHIHAVEYGSTLSLSTTTALLALYTDQDKTEDVYRLNYIDVAIYKES